MLAHLLSSVIAGVGRRYSCAYIEDSLAHLNRAFMTLHLAWTNWSRSTDSSALYSAGLFLSSYRASNIEAVVSFTRIARIFVLHRHRLQISWHISDPLQPFSIFQRV